MNTDKRFELIKITIDKLLLLGVLVFIAYFAQYVIGKIEMKSIAKEKFHEKRINIATDLATHCSGMEVSKRRLDELFLSFVDAMPTESAQAFIAYANYIKDAPNISKYADNLQKLQIDISRHSIEAKLFLGSEVSNAYSDFVSTLYSNTNPYPEIVTLFDEIAKVSESNPNIQDAKLSYRKFFETFKSDESMVNKYQDVISKLDNIIHSDL